MSKALRTGPCALLSIRASIEQQAQWLRAQNPSFLLTYPSVIHALARHFMTRGETLPDLREVCSYGEILEPRVRDDCRRALGVEIVDMYSTQEVGYVAMQCPEFEHYHVQAETQLVEVLDKKGRACKPGEVGKIVVTPLHNFAMPLIRYDIGDYAEIGEPCPCGRGLPVLKRILGRQRNMFLLPNGEVRWPSFEFEGAVGLDELPPVSQFQVIQKTLEELEVRLVVLSPLTAAEEKYIVEVLLKGLDYPFRVHIKYVKSIARSPGGKFEDFHSELTCSEKNP